MGGLCSTYGGNKIDPSVMYRGFITNDTNDTMDINDLRSWKEETRSDLRYCPRINLE
jgi:hypothetical protein